MITIYIIYHTAYEDTNIFTTDKTKIQEIIQRQTEKYPLSIEDGDWKWREIVEETEFQGDLSG